MSIRPLHAVALVCSLSPAPAYSSSHVLAQHLLDALPDATSEIIRVIDHNVLPGVKLDMGCGDGWPEIRSKILDADILILSTPIWLGQHSSVCQRVLERLDADLYQADDNGTPLMFGKVAIAAVVGSEDGAHHVSSTIFQCLDDVGFTIPAQGFTFWQREALHGVDHHDQPEIPDVTAGTTRVAAVNAAHLAGFLRATAYPPVAEHVAHATAV